MVLSMETFRISSRGVGAVRYDRRSGEVLDWHEHHNLSFCFVLRGEYEETIRNRTVVCRSGDVVIKRSDERHLNKFGQDGAVCLLLEISDQFLKDSSASSERTVDGPIQDHHLTGIGFELHEELRGPDRLSPIMLDSIATRSLVLAQRLNDAESKRLRRIDASQELLARVEELAAKCLTTSERQSVRRAFRETNGNSVYSLRRRAFRAFDEVVNTQHSLADISAGSGFYDQAHFTKVFARLFGVTPGRLRSRIGNSSSG
jgi:AraC-like DNA-binding protein/quercetin dioxygenase-like cupin family protein